MFGWHDGLLMAVVVLQVLLLTYARSPRWKSLLYMLPLPFSFALLATGSLVWSLPEEPLVNALLMGEDLSQGEHIRRWRLLVEPAGHTVSPRLIAEGYNVGHKQICPFPMVRIKELRHEIETDGPATLATLQLFGEASTWA